eukprot:3170582-Rhodomonas_salina.2
MSGTDAAYRTTRVQVTYGGHGWPWYYLLRPCYAISGTDLNCCIRQPVLPWTRSTLCTVLLTDIGRPGCNITRLVRSTTPVDLRALPQT